MDKQLKAKWVAALRSGDFIQGTSSFYNPKTNRYCALGVLYELHTPGVHLTKIHSVPSPPNIISQATWYKYSKLNDSGADFNLIANCIEADTTF